MLPSQHRLRRREDFATAVRRGRRAGRPLLVVHLNSGNGPHAPGEHASAVRAGFVVSKAVGSAVQRNLVKRRLRHLMRDRIAGLPPGSLVVVRALPGAAEAGFDRLSGDLDAALRRLSDPSPKKAPR
ncbi:ribonuclease P protein component [Streptomyces sp. NPDC051940]|uniref:ribonuclease P protein component n=1 Tax=Streptomyces sp. NPDC051940 TaxID=3155675 RepID=UPI003411F860